MNHQTTIVAHSAGCGFILKWLHENSAVRVAQLVLVAPWLDPKRRCGDFLSCTLNPTLQSRVDDIHVFYSSDEEVVGVAETKDLILQTYPKAQLHQFTDQGHFCLDEMGTEQFDALWEVAKP